MSHPGTNGPESSEPVPGQAPSSPQVRHSPRPGSVTAAGILAFILAAVQAFGGFQGILLASQISNLSAREAAELPSSGVLYFGGVLDLAIALLLVWGGVAALQGKTDRILLFTAMAVGILGVIGVFGNGIFSIAGLLVIVAAVILARLRAGSSREFFASHDDTAT